MTRIVIFLLWIILIAGAVTILTTFDDRITGEAFGQKFDGPSGLILGAVAFAFLIAIYLTHKIKDILALPAKIRAKDAETKRERGVAALTRGLEAVAVGDAADASHHAKVAQKNLQDLALTRLLSAQAAQLSGDETAARESFSAMLEAPETEFMGLKGLYAQSMAKGDHDEARQFAERAFALRANAGWAFQSVLDLSLERGAWGDARDAIARGKRNRLIGDDKAKRASAALLAAAADAAHASGDDENALSDAEAALKLAPALAPAAVLAAELYSAKGKTGKAASILETAFAGDPHPALIRAYDKLYTDETAEKRAQKLQKLAEKNSDALEAALVEARAANLLGDHAAAMTRLEPLITAGPNAHAYALMATAAAGLHGEEAARDWLERAAAAPRDPRPGADGKFHFTRAGWARLVREFMEHGRLAPPPLEDAGEAISADELRLLTAPPPPDALSGADEQEETDTDAPDPQTKGAVKNSDDVGHADVLEEKSDESEEAKIENDEDGERAAAAARMTP